MRRQAEKKRAGGILRKRISDTSAFSRLGGGCRIASEVLLEPFADRGIRICAWAIKLSICFRAPGIKNRDFLADFPRSRCRHQPSLACPRFGDSARLAFSGTRFDDLYKHCVDLCLRNANYVAAIIPASFLSSGLFRRRLRAAKTRFFATPKIRFVWHLARNNDAIAIYQSGEFVDKLSEIGAPFAEGRLLAARCILTTPRAIWG